jgi:hypothetical protein
LSQQIHVRELLFDSAELLFGLALILSSLSHSIITTLRSIVSTEVQVMGCANCRNALQSNWLFCPFCGHKAAAVQQTVSADSRAGSYGAGVRAQIFELAVRQALSGGAWRQTCASAMKSNNITPEEVEAEAIRRTAASVHHAPIANSGFNPAVAPIV